MDVAPRTLHVSTSGIDRALTPLILELSSNKRASITSIIVIGIRWVTTLLNSQGFDALAFRTLLPDLCSNVQASDKCHVTEYVMNRNEFVLRRKPSRRSTSHGFCRRCARLTSAITQRCPLQVVHFRLHYKVHFTSFPYPDLTYSITQVAEHKVSLNECVFSTKSWLSTHLAPIRRQLCRSLRQGLLQCTTQNHKNLKCSFAAELTEKP